MSGGAAPDSRPIEEETRRSLPPVQCHVCGDALGNEWVYLSARALAGRLYALDLCGVCWSLLRHAIDEETLPALGYVSPLASTARPPVLRRRARRQPPRPPPTP